MTLLKLSSWIVCNEVHRVVCKIGDLGVVCCYFVCKGMLVLRVVKYICQCTLLWHVYIHRAALPIPYMRDYNCMLEFTGCWHKLADSYQQLVR